MTFTPADHLLPHRLPGEHAYSTEGNVVVAGRAGEWTATWWSPLRSPHPRVFGRGRSRAGAVRDLTGVAS